MQTLRVDAEGAEEFTQKLARAVEQNPGIMSRALYRAMKEFEKMAPDAALSGPPGLNRRTGKTYQAGFKAYQKSTKKYSMGILWARIANLFQGKKKRSNLPTIMLMKIAEDAFKKTGTLERIVREEMERVYHD